MTAATSIRAGGISLPLTVAAVRACDRGPRAALVVLVESCADRASGWPGGWVLSWEVEHG